MTNTPDQIRIAELEKELAKAKKELTLADDMVNIILHDIRSPLTSIVDASKMLYTDETITEAEYRSFANSIYDSAKDVLRFTESHLRLSRVERGLYPKNFEDISILETLLNLKHYLKEMPSFSKHNIRITVLNRSDKPYTPTIAYGDKDLIWLMFYNIVKNAIEASLDTKEVSIKIMHQEDNITIYIHNQGIIPEEIRESFFEKYKTIGKKNGIGLGTYAAKIITEYHAGTISFTSNHENGTEIIVKLPSK